MVPFMKKALILFTFIFGIFNSQNLNLKKIEEQVLQNNRTGMHLSSQKQLLQLLEAQNTTISDEAKINFLLGTTFRSINDYGSSINYLKKSKKTAEQLTNADSLKMNIDAEMAFTYFDNHEYDYAEKIIKDITQKKYLNLNLLDKAYIIMQEGYITFLQKNYSAAETHYEESLAILHKNSPCNQPVVLVKQMQLYSVQNQFDKVDRTYKIAMKLADSCKIIKYKIYATEEIKDIYATKNNQQKVFRYSYSLDSLNLIDNREHKLSEMHVNNQNFLEEENKSEKESRLVFIILACLLGFLLLTLGLYFLRKIKFHNKEKILFEEELKKIKHELQLYSEAQFSQTNTENKILNSEKLNARQKELLELVSKGKSNREIAENLSITEATVKYHLGNIYSILDIKNRKEIFGKIIDK